MPWKNPKQAAAIFLNLQRRKGLAAAEAFGRKHREEMSQGARRPYKSKQKRS